jgi:uncharacterized pyridoxamine 5'-phosphate oxidase family protein
MMIEFVSHKNDILYVSFRGKLMLEEKTNVFDYLTNMYEYISNSK